MIVLTAGVLGISPSLFEAARVDGASSWQIFKSVTLPLLRPIMLFTLVNSARQMGKAAAASLVLFVVTLFFSLILFYIMRDKDAIKEKKAIKAAQKARKEAK